MFSTGETSGEEGEATGEGTGDGSHRPEDICKYWNIDDILKYWTILWKYWLSAGQYLK